jgi:hypothetical protein
MPLELSFAAPWIRLRFSDALTAADLAEVAERFRGAEGTGVHYPKRLADLSGITVMEVRTPEVLSLAQQRRVAPLPGPVRTALVAVTPVQLGIARMFQTLNDHPLIELRVFPDREAALAWLGDGNDAPANTPTGEGDGPASPGGSTSPSPAFKVEPADPG